MSKSSKKPGNRRPSQLNSRLGRRMFTKRLLQTEQLETRMLLAADMVDAWQNPINCNDVDQDGIVAAIDAKLVVETINLEGARALGDAPSGEPGSVQNLMMYDTNGDGFVSSLDAKQIFEELNAQGENELLQIRLEVTDLDGNAISVAQVGEQFRLSAFVQDLRDASEAQGVFAGFADVTYDQSLVSVADDDVVFGDNYPNGSNSDTTVAGLIDEIGAFAGGTPLGADELLLFTVTMNADAAGTLDFSSNPAENLPRNEVLLFGIDDPIEEGDIDYGSVSLAIQDGTTTTGPSINQIAPNDTLEIEIESPLQLPIDGVDSLGQGLSYTVSVDDPSLVDANFTTGNRSWQLEIADFGTMVFEFFEDRASRATDRFITLTEDGFFDGITFHRVIDGFVIQGGDPTATGTGGSDLGTFDDQFHIDLQHNQAGILSMAKSADDTNNSQFFVTDAPTPWLDANHTIFGQLVEGFDVLEAITAVQTGFSDKPTTDVVITRATVFDDTENAILSLRALDSTGSTEVTVTATDDNNNAVSDTFTVNLAPSSQNTPPFLEDIPALTANAGSTFDFQLGHVDVEDDDVFFFATVVSPSDATATVSDSGLVTVEIPATAGGSAVVLDVTVSASSFVGSVFDRQRVSIAVENVIVGTVEADQFTVDEESTTTLEPLANDNLGSDAVITSAFGADINGTATIAADGQSIVYTPSVDFFGDASFTYTVQSSDGLREGTIEVTVENVLDGPNAADDFFPQDLDENDERRALFVEDADGASDGIQLNLFNNDLNQDGNEQEIMLISSVTDPQFGSLTFNSFGVTYTPAADFFGTDTFTYTTTGSGTNLTSTGTVTIEIAEWNDAPVVQGETRSAVSAVTTIFSAADLLANDTPGPDNESDQTLRLLQVNYTGTGTAILNADGDIEYTSAAGFTGEETIAYSVQDDGTTQGNPAARASIAALTVNVTAGSLANDDVFVASTSSVTLLDVLTNDAAGVTIGRVTQPAVAQVGIASGQIAFTANGATLPQVFEYTVLNSDGEESTASVTVTLVDPSVAVDDTFQVSDTLVLNVLDNDQLAAGIETSVLSVTQPANGTVTLENGLIQFEPSSIAGSETFTYTIEDGNGFASTATVTVEITAPVNNPPLAFNDDVEVVADGGAQQLDVLANDTALPDTNETLTISAITTMPQNGTATISAAGDRIVYSPTIGFGGLDSLQYEVSDGNGGTATATVDITVPSMGTNLAAVNDSFSVVSRGVQTYNVLLNDLRDADTTLSIISLDSTGSNGTAEINFDGTRIQYTPNFSSPGIDAFTYTIGDGTGETSTGTVTVSVTDLSGESVYSGQVFNDIDQDGILDSNERGYGGVTVVLSGTDSAGNSIRKETSTALNGEFSFVGIGAGDYTVTQEQPAFTNNGLNTLGLTTTESDEFDFTVTEQLIGSEGNIYAEQGMFARFALVDALSSQREPGLFIVMDGDELAWVENRGGWDDVESVAITSSGDSLTVSSSAAGAASLSMTDRTQVKLIGSTGGYTILRVNGTSDLLSAAAVDQVFAS